MIRRVWVGDIELHQGDVMAKSQHEWNASRVAARRDDLQAQRDRGIDTSIKAWMKTLVPAPVLVAITMVATALQAPEDVQIAFGVPAVAATAFALYAGSQLGKLKAERKLRVYVEGGEGNDATSAIPSLNTLIDELKAPHRDQVSIRKAYDRAVDRLQGLRPDRPLSQCIRYGYYPSRPNERVSENVYRTVDNDAKDGSWHWERMIEADDVLRRLLTSGDVITEDRVDEALAKLIPPLRAVMRTHRVSTWRIDYMPQTAVPAGPGGDLGDRTDSVVTEPAPVRDHPQDVLTPVEGRMNASGTMTAATLRTLVTAFRAADPQLFLGDDRETGEAMLDSHLARLVSAFRVADEASSGDERDQVRVDFARSLAVMRDTLEGIMARHVQAARRLLEDQARFIESRHGEGPLPPS